MSANEEAFVEMLAIATWRAWLREQHDDDPAIEWEQITKTAQAVWRGAARAAVRELRAAVPDDFDDLVDRVARGRERP